MGARPSLAPGVGDAFDQHTVAICSQELPTSRLKVWLAAAGMAPVHTAGGFPRSRS